MKYPKLLLLIVSFVSAYFLFVNKDFYLIHNFLLSLSLFGIFISGFFYAYGFTSAPSAAVLLILAKQYNLFTAALVGGLGALLGDMVIFLFIRTAVSDEIKQLSKTDAVRTINKNSRKLFGRFRKYLPMTFAGFLIASPLPTEAGVALMASSKSVSLNKFAVIAYCLHTAGIFIILLAGNLI